MKKMIKQNHRKQRLLMLLLLLRLCAVMALGQNSVSIRMNVDASDAARTPELYWLAARWWRRALAEVLPELLPEGEAEEAARLILRENARRLYRL